MKSATVKGVTSLVKNSPELMTLIILTVYSIHDEDGSKIESKDIRRKCSQIENCLLLETADCYKTTMKAICCCLSFCMAQTSYLCGYNIKAK